MEVQLPQQQSVQINLNNKIITLHNVTIVKNPRIVKVDAAQYSNLLKGAAGGSAPIKLINGGSNTIKLPMPTLVPMKSSQTHAFIKTTVPSFNQMAPNSVIKQAPNIVTTQIIRTLQQTTGNGIIQLKPTLLTSQNTNTTFSNSVKLQTIPAKPTVIISPPKVTQSSASQNSPPKLSTALSPLKIQTTSVLTHPSPHVQVSSNQTSVITSKLSPVAENLTSRVSPSLNSAAKSPAILPIQTKVIVSPPLKNKIIDSNGSASPQAKKPCKKLEFPCIFCEEIFLDEPQSLMNHMNQEHADKLPKIEDRNISVTKVKEVIIADRKQNAAETSTIKYNDNSLKINESKSDIETSNESSSSDEDEDEDEEDNDEDIDDEDEECEEDDDESEVNDLIMDLENTQDTEEDEASSQDRSNTPESPEFEEHVPSQNDLHLSSEVFEEVFNEDEYDLDILSILLEPFVELLYDEGDEYSQEENEAMKLYREAMEVNYQQNGIKKRGRRKSRVPKPSADSMGNGILANLLDSSVNIKIPQGPGRGRRKEVNEKELEMDRNNGVCFFQCTQCDKSFKFAGDLAKHVRSHTISSPYRCSICGKVFTHIGSLNTHLRIHSGERPYKCKFCDKSFTQSNSLMVHVKSHLSNKPFTCEMCNKGFLNASSLALHQKTHTGPSAVICPITACGKEFRDNNLLEEHMQTHKQSMLYQCSQCLEKFEQACQLVQHVKSHIGDKPFQCTICSRAFTQPGSLNTHLRIHTGEKPFACVLCPKRFTQASSLSVHMKIHGEKEWKCDLCNKSFSQEAFLLKHRLKHKEDDSQNYDDLNLPIMQE